MLSRFARGLSLGVAVAGLALALAFTTPTWLHAQSGVIHACVGNNGLLRVATDCRQGETPLVWNAQGPAGPAGPQGPQGDVGPQGPQGPAGENPPPPASALTAQITLEDSTPTPLLAGPSPIISFSLGGTNPTTIGSATGGAGAGKISFAPLNVTKMIDGLSPITLTRLANGDHFNEVKVEVFGAGHVLLATYRFKTAFVTSDLIGANTMSLEEQVTFVFGILEADINVNGVVVHSCWNQITNEACP